MTAIKSLWASVQGDPVFMRRVNGWFTIFWIVMIPVSILLGLLSSVAYVSALSLWALVSGHWSAWQAARVEVAQQAEVEAREEEPVEEKVVDELIARTDIKPSLGAGTPAPSPTVEGRLAELVVGVAELQRLLINPVAPTATSNRRKPVGRRWLREVRNSTDGSPAEHDQLRWCCTLVVRVSGSLNRHLRGGHVPSCAFG